FDLELEGRAPWIAIVRRQRRGPLVDLAPGLLCIWRTCIRRADAASDTARELITPLHVPRLDPPLHQHRLSAPWRELGQRLLESDLHNHMERALDACVRSTIEAWNGRERAFQERAEARDAAIARALHTMWARLEAQRQPLLFADIAADCEARQPTHWRAPPPGRGPPAPHPVLP